MSKKTTPKAKKTTPKAKKYNVLKLKSTPPKKGLIAVKKAHGTKLGVTCLFCEKKLKPARNGRKPEICGNKTCFRKKRAHYRYDWEALSPAFSKAA